MQYEGKLYGKSGDIYFPLLNDSKDFDNLLEGVKTAIIGMEWRMEVEPETLDKADYEQLDNWKQLVEQVTSKTE